MKSKLALLCLAAVCVFLIACPMPQVGVGTTKDATGGANENGPLAAGASISVVNDEARNQAVYINENGVRFDVTAEEYPGGPLVACVQVADFTLVPASDDPDALPVKALITGMRDNGTPGVWEIHADDTIHLPQPEQTDDNTARCIVGGDMSTLPDVIQLRFGWTFETVAFSSDAKMIVGKATNKRGATIGGVYIEPNTPIGVYWRVYSLPYTRFCIVSAPHIIGTIVPQTLPPRWSTRGHDFSERLRQLKLLLTGKLESYLTEPFPYGVSLEKLPGMTQAQAMAAGVYLVTGLDEYPAPAVARIEKNGNVTIRETLPDLEFGAVSVPTPPQDLSSSWSVNVPLSNVGEWDAKSVTMKYFVRNDAGVTVEIGRPVVGATIKKGETAPNTSVTTTLAPNFTQAANGIPVKYYVYAVVTAVLADNYNLDLGITSPEFEFSVTIAPPPPPQNDVLKLEVLDPPLGPISLGGSWSFIAGTKLNDIDTTPTKLDVYVKNDLNPTVGEFLWKTLTPGSQVAAASVAVPVGYSVSGKGSDFDGLPGTHHIRVVATVSPLTTAEASLTAEASCTVVVKYSRIFIDTYDPSGNGGGAGNSTYMEFYRADGSMITSNDSGPGRSGDLNLGYAYIDWKEELLPGDYYILVKESNSPPLSDAFGYGIRALIEPSTNAGPKVEPITPQTASDSPLIGGATPGDNQVLIVNGSALGRWIPGDPNPAGVNWIRLTLP